MKETTSKLLAYSKEFFLSGKNELNQDTNMAYMQAVLKFHDAVEFCVRAIIEEYKVNHDRNSDLFTLMKCVNKSIPDKSLPLASQMDFLNTARAKIKHHASVPSIEDTQRCHINTKEFLEQVIEDYLDTDFLSVSRLLLIKNSTTRQHLEEADKKRKESDYLEALIEVKKAFYSARPSDQVFVSKDAFFSSFFLTSGFRDIEDLKEPIEKIIDKIIELENNVALVMMGVDVLKLRRFEEITPHFTFYANGGCSILWKNSIIPTGEMVEEAVNFVTDMTLQWERMGVVANRPDRNHQPYEPWDEVRREDWDYYQH